MKRSIIFVNVGLFFQRDAIRFGCTYLMEKGYLVEIWDLLTERPMDFRATMPLYNGDNYYEYTYDEFRDNLNRHMQDIYVFIYASDDLFLRICTEIINLGCRYILIPGIGGVYIRRPDFLSRNLSFLKRNINLILTNDRKKWKSILLKKLQNLSKRNAARKIITQYFTALQNKPPLAVLTGTHKAYEQLLVPKQLQSNILYTHALDYDRFIEENRKRNNHPHKYVVFCDSGFGATHYDSVIAGEKPLIDKTKFFMQIESLLSKLEEHYNLPAVILGHPHVKYEEGMFAGRKIVFNRTCEFARNAEVFVLNMSASINFALLYDVPILQVANQDFKKITIIYPNLYEYILLETEKVICAGFLDLDNKSAMEHPWDYVKRASASKREEYIRTYIIDNDTTDKCTYEYLEDVIRHELSGTEKRQACTIGERSRNEVEYNKFK